MVDRADVRAFVDASNAAESFLSPEEREILNSYNAELAELYPEGIPKDQDEAILKAMGEKYPGVGGIILKVLRWEDEMMTSVRRKI